jgi:hypothetical protein
MENYAPKSTKQSIFMTLNYIVLGLIFLAGTFLVLGAALDIKILFGNEKIENETIEQSHSTNQSTRGFFNPMGNISRIVSNFFIRSNQKRIAYLFLGIVIIILGFVAIFFTDFLDKPITFE